MAEVMLTANQYGKAENRVVRVVRDSERHEVAYFGSLGLVAVALGAVLWAASPRIRRLMSDVR